MREEGVRAGRRKGEGRDARAIRRVGVGGCSGVERRVTAGGGKNERVE